MGTPAFGDQRLPDRIWNKLQVDPLTSCWIWTGGDNGKGYGVTNVGLRSAGTKRMAYVHRLAYEVLVGPIPSDKTIDHLCRVRGCANPEHLEPVPHGVNLLRGETVNAHGAAKTECLNGHPYDEHNTYRCPKGKRRCRACTRIQARDRYHRAKSCAAR